MYGGDVDVCLIVMYLLGFDIKDYIDFGIDLLLKEY